MEIAFVTLVYFLLYQGIYLYQFLKYQTDRLVKDLDEHHLSYAYLCIPDRKFGHVASVTQIDEDHCQKANEQVLAFLRSTID